MFGCGWFLDCLSSRGIHVLTSSTFLRINDDIGLSDVGAKFLPRSFMCLMDILVTHPKCIRDTKTRTMHDLS